MNICTQKFSWLYSEIRYEAYHVKHYLERHVKDFSSILKSNPYLTCAYVGYTCMSVAFLISQVTLPIFFIIFSTAAAAATLHYLDTTYFYRQPSEYSLAFWNFINDLHRQNSWLNYPFLSVEEKEELINQGEIELVNYQQKAEKKALEERHKYENDDRPVFLILQAKSDFNGALDLHKKDNYITINGNNNIGVKKIKEKYKIVLINHLKNIDDIKSGLEKITSKVHHLWIFAHGTPLSMELNSDNIINPETIDQLYEGLQNKLSEDAHVVLYSCSTGKKIGKQDNIATKLSKMLQGRTIWAQTLSTARMNVDFNADGSATVNFIKSKSRLRFFIEKVSNFCFCRPLKDIELELNVTAQLRNGIEQPTVRI